MAMGSRPPWTDEFIDSDGVRIATRDYGGGGTPVVLVHGHFGNLAESDSLCLRLAQDLRVVAYDQRGHGWSEAGPVTVEGYVSDLSAVVERFGLEGPVVYGCSFGALVSLAYLGTGKSVRGFINEDGSLTDRPAPPDLDETPGRVRMMTAEELDATRARFDLIGADGAAALQRATVRHRDGRVEIRPTQSDLDAKLRAFAQVSVPEVYRAFTSPVLILVADRKPDDHLRWQSALLEHLATGGPLEIRHFATGHSIHGEQQEEVAAAVTDFVRSL